VVGLGLLMQISPSWPKQAYYADQRVLLDWHHTFWVRVRIRARGRVKVRARVWLT